MPWQLQQAKQRFSEVVRKALREGPQIVTRHGEEVVVIVSAEEFRRRRRGRRRFKEFLRTGPDISALDLTRRRDMPREVDL